MKKLLIVGPSIERGGIGGVTVHCQRLRDWLDKEKFPYEFADYKALGFWGTIRRIAKSKWVHLNVSNPTAILLFVIAARLTHCKTIMTLHGSFDRFKGKAKRMTKWALKMSNNVVALNQKSLAEISQFNKKTVCCSAFIPPINNKEFPEDITHLLEQRKKCFRKICSTNAFNEAYDSNGNEIYGIDFLVKHFEKHPDFCLFISDPSGAYAEKYKRELPENIVILSHPHSYFNLMKNVDFSIRNTSTDGDSLSVKESLYLGIPTLCSNAVERPAGVRIFNYCDEKSFETAVNDIDNGVFKDKIEIGNGAYELMKFYNQLGIKNKA